MTARPPARRGACPALTAPMETGDGLLVRLVPADGRLAPLQLAALARAAEAYGNGIVEVTARGSLQIRGLRPQTVGPLNAAVADLAITPRDGLPVDISPLAGLDPGEIADARPLAARIRAGTAPFAHGLGPKVSVVIDGGGAIALDALKADVRLAARRTSGGVRWAVALAGDAAGARLLALLPADEAVAETVRRLAKLAARGRKARMADLLAAAAPDRTAAPMAVRNRTAIGPIPLAGGAVARGIGLPFGAVEAETLAALATAARAAGADDLRPAPGRVLLACGIDPRRDDAFAAAAHALGFLVDAQDPRASVIACPGAPACAGAHMPARAVAAAASRALAPVLDGSLTVHLSACTKGCAHPAAADLTLVGVEGGVALRIFAPAAATADFVPATAELGAITAGFASAGIADALHRLAGRIAQARAPGETSREALARLAPFPPAPDPMTHATAHPTTSRS